jgi:pyruvate ferredoxin oxidoreductase gamma subunit
MQEMLEIRWHARGGQGAKTAALLLAESLMGEGTYVQAFPEYGPERMGAPMRSYDRISSKPIRLHTSIKNPDVVIILDPSLLADPSTLDGLKEDGIILVNTVEDPKTVREKYNIKGRKIYTLNASQLAQEELKRDLASVPMLGALIRVTGLVSLEDFLTHIRKELERKFAHRPEVIEANLKLYQRAYQEVKGE